MSFELIQKALDVALVNFGQANGIAVALENIDAPTDAAKPYLAGFLLPAPVEQADLYFTDRHRGVYQIDINYAKNIGSATLNRMADLLHAAFKPSSCFTRGGVCVQVTNFSPERVMIGNGWAKKPISITWTTYTERL